MFSTTGFVMSLMYRAIWRDDRRDLIPAAANVFEDWLRSKKNKTYSSELKVPPDHNGTIKEPLNELFSTSVTVGESQALRIRLNEERQFSYGKERWSTTATFIRTPVQGDVWIDLEWVSDDTYRQRPDRQPPGLIKKLLEDSDAELGDNPLKATPTPVGSNSVNPLLAWLVSSSRHVPLVLFSIDSSLSGPEYSERVKKTAARLAGCADVRMLVSESQDTVNAALAQYDLDVHSGAARVYLPGIESLQSSESWRHRYVRSHRLSPDANQAARQISSVFIDRMVARRPPASYSNELKRALESASGDNKDWQEEAFRLDEENQALRDQLDSALYQLDAAFIEASESEEEALKNQFLSDAYAKQLRENGESPELINFDAREDVADLEFIICEDAIKAARKLPGLYFTDETPQDLDRIQDSPFGITAAKKIYRHLQALSAYSQSNFDGDFYMWCTTSGDNRVLSSNRVAMRESETIAASKRSRDARSFKVATEVDLSGRVFMEAHTKPINKGTSQVPRIYFHDDVKGPTKGIHIGFIGPHDLVENQHS